MESTWVIGYEISIMTYNIGIHNTFMISKSMAIQEKYRDEMFNSVIGLRSNALNYKKLKEQVR